MSASSTELPAAAAEPELEPGIVVGEYTVESKLGQGAFGKVYKAAHPLIGKIVAIKVLGRRFSVDPEMVSRFVAEARAVNQIRHRHIIDIFSFGQLEDGRQYYVMEYLEGEPLDVRLERDHRLSLSDALPILRGVAKALDAAHAKGIAHRDLKAENVFLANDPDGGVFPKLLDFGIAKLLANDEGQKHKTRTGMSVGTPYYMSPEQSRGRDVDHRTDIYAFGVLVYLVLTGKFPFDGDDFMSILMQQVTADAKPLSSHVPELTEQIDDVVAWLLRKEASERPENLRTAMRALEEAGAKAGLIAAAASSPWDVQTGPVGTVTVPPNVSRAAPTGEGLPMQRSRAPLYAIIAALAIGGAVAVWFALKPGDEPPGAPKAAAPAPAPAPAPTPAPAPAPPPAPAPTPPPAPASVIVTIKGVPDGTEVLAGGKTIAAAPGPVQLPHASDATVLTFKADGYVTASRTVVPDKDQTLDVGLKAKPKAGGGKKTGKDDIIDVFGGGK
jgi:serine/threonine-protein kinase